MEFCMLQTGAPSYPGHHPGPNGPPSAGANFLDGPSPNQGLNPAFPPSSTPDVLSALSQMNESLNSPEGYLGHHGPASVGHPVGTPGTPHNPGSVNPPPHYHNPGSVGNPPHYHNPGSVGNPPHYHNPGSVGNPHTPAGMLQQQHSCPATPGVSATPSSQPSLSASSTMPSSTTATSLATSLATPTSGSNAATLNDINSDLDLNSGDFPDLFDLDPQGSGNLNVSSLQFYIWLVQFQSGLCNGIIQI